MKKYTNEEVENFKYKVDSLLNNLFPTENISYYLLIPNQDENSIPQISVLYLNSKKITILLCNQLTIETILDEQKVINCLKKISENFDILKKICKFSNIINNNLTLTNNKLDIIIWHCRFDFSNNINEFKNKSDELLESEVFVKIFNTITASHNSLRLNQHYEDIISMSYLIKSNTALNFYKKLEILDENLYNKLILDFTNDTLIKKWNIIKKCQEKDILEKDITKFDEFANYFEMLTNKYQCYTKGIFNLRIENSKNDLFIFKNLKLNYGSEGFGINHYINNEKIQKSKYFDGEDVNVKINEKNFKLLKQISDYKYIVYLKRKINITIEINEFKK